MPSLRRNACLLILFGALLAILADWTDAAWLDRAWLLPFVLLGFGLAYEAWTLARARLQVGIGIPGDLKLGRSGPIEVTATQTGGRPIELQLAVDAPTSLTIDTGLRALHLEPAGLTTAVSMATAHRLGAHAWPPLRAQISGVLQLAWWPRVFPAASTVRVVPDYAAVGRATVGLNRRGVASRARSGTGSDILQLRPYRPGDPLHRIDWKASARAGDWVSRDLVEDQHLDILLLVDAGRSSRLRAGTLDRLGYCINTAARFAEHALEHEDRVGLVVYADRVLAAVPPVRGWSGVVRLRSALSAIEAHPAESDPLHAASHVRGVMRSRALVVFLTDLDDATVTSQLAGAARLLVPRHLPLIAGFASRSVRGLATAKARTEADAHTALAAQEYHARLQRNVGILKSLGAEALVAFPEHFAAAVIGQYAELRQRRRI